MTAADSLPLPVDSTRANSDMASTTTVAAPSPVPSVSEKVAEASQPQAHETLDGEHTPSPEHHTAKDEADGIELETRSVSQDESKAAPNTELQRIKTSDEGTEYPTGVKLVLITLALCLSVFLVALDNTIIATAIPKITDQFNSLDDVGWYGSAYLLTTAALQLMFGKFYSFFSIKTVFLVAIGIFELGSLVCGAAPNSTALIIGRAIAGIGSAGIFSGALIIIAYSVPLRKRPIFSGQLGAMYGIASVAGPLLGGVFTDKVTWRWCFYINLPIGAVAIAVVAMFFKAPHRAQAAALTWQEKVKQFDLIGTVFFIPAIICLLLALQWGGTTYAWGNARIIVLFIVFAICIAIFIYIQIRDPEVATVNPRIFMQRSIWSGCFFAFCLGASFFLLVYYVPIWFQAVKGASALQSGIDVIPQVLTLVVVSILSGGLITALGYYTPFMIFSSVLMSIGAGLLTTWKPDTDHQMWIGYQAIYGIGIGAGMQQPLIAVQTVLDISEVPTGTAILIFLQTLGGALFVSVGENIFTNTLVKQLQTQVPGLDPAIVLATGATAIQSTIDPAYLPGVTLAYNNALTTAFQVSLAMSCFSLIGALFIEWKSVKGKKIEMAVA